MRATVPTTLRLLACLGLLLALAAAGCNKPRKVEHGSEPAPKAPKATAPDGAAAGTDAEPAEAPDVTTGEVRPDLVAKAPEAPPEPAEKPLKEKLKELKFKARREVVWARTTIDNIPSYERALEKYQREFDQWRMYERVPLEPKKAELKAALTELFDRLGLPILYYAEADSTVPPRKLPEVIHGDKAFEFEDNDVREIFHVTIRTGAATPETVASLVTELKALDRLLYVRRVKVGKEELLVNLDTYFFRAERYPVHQVLERKLEERMRQMGIARSVDEVVNDDPLGHLQNAALSYREFNANLEALNEAMALLSRSKFLEARSSFFRRAVEEARQADPRR
jgi:hypothetical protein